MVPVNGLLRHLHGDPACVGITEEELIEFLRDHELFKVLEPPGLASEPEGAEVLDAAGLNARARVILSTRIPSADELGHLMNQELTTLASALAAALKQAREQSQPDQEERLRKLLARLGELKQELQELP